MKFKVKRLIATITLLIYLFTLIPCVYASEEGNMLIGGDFELEEEFSPWIGATRDEGCAYDGDWGILVSNPYGDTDMGVYGHFLEYDGYITLEKGKFYTFSAYVSNPMADDLSTPTATAYVGRSNSELFIDISSVGYNWEIVSASFMATESTDASLTITLEGGDMDIGFFMDSISITEETRIPAYTILEGPDSVFIPENGFADYRYSIITYDTDDMPINVLISSLEITVDSLPDGVEFDKSTGYVRVHSNAEADCSFTLICNASAGITLSQSAKTITTTKNLLSDPDFEHGEENWISDGEIEYSDGQLSLYASEKGEYGRYATISYSSQLFLQAGNMYVFRADVGSTEEYSASTVYISNLSFASSGYAEINITGIGGEWSRVTSAFLIEDTGLYDLTLNLYAPSERPVFVDNVYLGTEQEAPSAISIRAPGHVQIPTSVTALPCYANVLNQLGNAMDGYEPELSISPLTDGVYLSDGQIIIESSARSGDYTVTAEYGSITAEHTVSVSTSAIGDGGFEEREANEWWTASDGAVFSIIDYDGDKAGHVYCPDTSCIVINNSYMELLENEYYVFSAAAGFGKGTVTAFIADAYTGEYVPFAQYDPLTSQNIPFSVDSNILGRLVLYIESEGPIGLLFDDIDISPAVLTAADITVTGGTYGDFIRGSYNYVNNMTDAPDADISATRWYISPTAEGHFEPIGVPNQDYLEFTEDMAGQYILFEITPICSYTGLVAEAVRSLPVLIDSEPNNNQDFEPPLSPMTPVELDNGFTHPFIDINSHWAEKMIASLLNSGVVAGKTATHFYPEHYITRAEFTALVARAFSLVSLPYSNQFSDVSASDWYSGWIEACYRRGIITGVNAETFNPNGRITREQMAVILYRAYLLAEGPLPYDLPLRYYDNFMISPWAQDAVKNTTNLNLFTGDDMNLFKPQDFATRAQAAAVLYRALKCF